MSRAVIPVVLKDAPRQNLLISLSFELLFSLLGKSRHFSMQRCVFHAYCILSGRGCCQVRAAPPSTPLCACFPLALHFLVWISLLLASPWWVSHSCDIHSEGDITSINLFYQSHVVTCGDTNHGIYFAFSISTVFPGFCCDFSWFRLSASCQICLSPYGFPLSMLYLESKCPSCPKSAR